MKKYVLLLLLLVVVGCDEPLTLEPPNPATAALAKQLQGQTALDLALPAEKTIELDSETSMEFVLIPAGQFNMGSPKTEKRRESDEGPLHHVTISKPFYMAKHEITQAQYKAIMGRLMKPCKFTGDSLPVENVDWNQADTCLKALSKRTGMEFRLPTEAEWEYACRAGTSTPFNTGETINPEQANYDSKYVYGKGVVGACKEATVPVGSYPPNAFGLYDMHGNVWEWCSDLYKNNYYKNSEPVDPKGPATGGPRVIRGGSWNHNPIKLRSADRNKRIPGADRRYLGFRALLEIE